MKTKLHLFKSYGKSFQETIFQGLITDHEWAKQMIEVMSPEYFDVVYLEFLTEKYFAYFEKYKTFPNLPILVDIIKNALAEGNDILLRDQIVAFISKISKQRDISELQYVKDRTIDFCRRQAMKDALNQAVELIEDDKYESVVDLMKAAVSVGLPASVGHNFFEDIEARFVDNYRNAVPTGIKQLDAEDILRGGLGSGELGVIVANTGVGKSHFLIDRGAAAIRDGKNVVHYTFELTEVTVGTRYDSNLCYVASNKVFENKQMILDTYKEKEYGGLIIKEYPTGTATVNTLRNHIEKLMCRGFLPDMIVIDYADIMRSTRQYDSMRHELKLVYEQLRNLSMELNVPIWTASQANRDSSKADIVGLENMSEAYGKAMVADVVITVSRKPEEKALGSGRMHMAKNRAGRDGITWACHIDTSQSRFTIIDNIEMSVKDFQEQTAENMKEKLKTVYKELKSKKYEDG